MSPPWRPACTPGREIPVDAFDRTESHKLASGTLATIDNQVDTTTGTFKLRATFANEDESLFPSQFVNVRMLLNVDEGATVIPTSGVERGSQGTYVYLAKEDSTVTARAVTLGPTEGELVAVTSGLVLGDRIVVDGADKLKEGMQVIVQEPPASHQGVGDPAATRRRRRRERRRQWWRRRRRRPASRFAPGRSELNPASPSSVRLAADEPLSHLHSPADRHDAAHGGDPDRRPRGLQVPAAVRAAGSGLSDDPGSDVLSRGEPRRHDLFDHRSAGAPARRNAGIEADVLDELVGRVGHHPAIWLWTSTWMWPSRRFEAAINAAGNLLPADLPMPPVYAKVNPADAPVLTLALTSEDIAANGSRRFGGYPACPKVVTTARGGPGEHRRRPAPIDAHPGQSAHARGLRPQYRRPAFHDRATGT